MSKKKAKSKYPRGAGLAIGLLFGIIFVLITGNTGLFVIGIAIGVALEST